MSNIDLGLIAEARCDEPLNTWPGHTHAQESMFRNDSVFDHRCLRCWLEEKLSLRLKELKSRKEPHSQDAILHLVSAAAKQESQIDKVNQLKKQFNVAMEALRRIIVNEPAGSRSYRVAQDAWRSIEETGMLDLIKEDNQGRQ